MKSLWDNKISILAAAGIVLGIYMSKGGMVTALVPLIRFVLPVLAILLVLKMIKNKVGGAIGGSFKKRMQEAMEEANRRQQATAGGTASAQTLDLCNSCGVYKQPGHVCK